MYRRRHRTGSGAARRRRWRRPRLSLGHGAFEEAGARRVLFQQGRWPAHDRVHLGGTPVNRRRARRRADRLEHQRDKVLLAALFAPAAVRPC